MSRRMTVSVAMVVFVVCAEFGACHQPADWKGKSAEQLETQIKGVVAGKTKHPKKLALTDAQIADVAAYWAASAN
jgi:mono/diheme cytochrome c family protein